MLILIFPCSSNILEILDTYMYIYLNEVLPKEKQNVVISLNQNFSQKADIEKKHYTSTSL